MRIIMATWAKAEYQGRIMTELGALNRLISYWEIKTEGDHILPEYVAHGSIRKAPKK